jgi:hypothetical protein
MNNWGSERCNLVVTYSDHVYLIQNWDAECEIIRRWCTVIGVKEFTVKKPETEKQCIIVEFKEPIILDDKDNMSDWSEEYSFEEYMQFVQDRGGPPQDSDGDSDEEMMSVSSNMSQRPQLRYEVGKWVLCLCGPDIMNDWEL